MALFKQNITRFLLPGISSLIVLYFLVLLITLRTETPGKIEAILKSDSIRIGLEEFGKDRLRTLLLVEDPGFYSHKGIDFKSPGSVWTTISQGLVKMFYFEKFKPGIAKIKLIFLTRFIFDPMMAKDQQLLLFINRAYLGNYAQKEIRGFQEASNVYFGKEFTELSNDEYLSLVVMIINPNKYNLQGNLDQHLIRKDRINNYLNGNCVPVDWKDVELINCD